MIRRQSYSLYGIVVTIFFFFLFASPTLQFCRHDQRDALLEFKKEFSVSYMSSWNNSIDCCSWEGVTCNARSGEVISLYLDNVSLNNTMKPNSGLFKLNYLQSLTLRKCNLYGEIPSSLGNLSQLIYLELSQNELVGQLPTSIGNLTQLSSLSLTDNHLSGKIPVSFANLTKLSTLHLTNNYFESELPLEMRRLHNLEYIFLSGNSFSGPFPSFLFTISSLQVIYSKGNQFKGPIEFRNTSSSSRLHSLSLSSNQCDGPIPESISKLFNLNILDLSFNNFIGPIPRSISQLVNLRYLDLSHNKFEGEVPHCLWRLQVVKLSYNSFSSFGKSSQVFAGTEMNLLSLLSNSFQGPFPHWICDLTSLVFLDMSINNFSGLIPSCLRNNTNLEVLNLGYNSFSGTFPDMFVNATNLKTLDISWNQLEGKLSKSLINCKAMRHLNVGSNKFKDKFPSWLGSLPSLNVLILRSNKFYGPLYDRQASIGFQSLKVIDISQNDFSGTIPAFYFSSWSAMATSQYDNMYMEDFMVYVATYRNSMEFVHKGVETEFSRIREDFIAIDFSGNKFGGKIPDSIGLLKGLRLLNLSSNAFTSDIPQSLAKLNNLEALDLSRNQLLGQIPRDLGTLSFLSTMNFSHNKLVGPIPQGTQFQSQNCSSFMSNSGLYDLEGICGKPPAPNLTPHEWSEPEEQVINWIAAAIAYGPGVFCGLVIGHIFVSHSHKHEWFMEKFRKNKHSTTE
ncbi:hypothetical protein CARUB_v10025111mg [Capsella rubella]|uniref:Uncharacterized protein n=1 Tax=Capsella rubella TaxID=81985 RepID=R0G0D4_9BRAS|nr:receptor like protein 30 [Capsella rubella]EOA28867.1 hypothetical protein CARUB_v10025111mg [Capsella rubella]